MDTGLIAFWISFTGANRPQRFGVTGWSQEDAFCLLEEQGYDVHLAAGPVLVKAGVKASDLDANTILPNIGPITVRGVWYPA